jgi:hypothetical protein
MKACTTCGGMYEDDWPNCPACAKKVGRLLSTSLTAPESLVHVTMRVIGRLHSTWGLQAGASGWRVVDMISRAVLVAALVAVIVTLIVVIPAAQASAQERLDSHARFIRDHRGRNLSPVDREQTLINYERLHASASELVSEQTRDSWHHVWALLAIMALLVVSVLGKYRGHRNHNEMRAAIAFLCSPEGRPFVEQLQRRETERRVAVRPDGKSVA